MVVQPKRLDWAGNVNWLLKQQLKEFFCYRQHDDTTAPEFFEVLLEAADKDPKAASIYCDCQYSGGSNRLEIVPSIKGDTLYRMVQYIDRVLVPPMPIRGLIRSAALDQAGPLRIDGLRSVSEVCVWMAKLLHWGSFRRIAKPLYYKLDHAKASQATTKGRPKIASERYGQLCSRAYSRPQCRSAVHVKNVCFFSIQLSSEL